MSMNMESHINETLQTTKKRKNAAESKKSATTTSTKCQKLTNYFFVVPKSTNPEAVTAVDAEGKLTDKGDKEIQAESRPYQASKESAAIKNAQVQPVTIPAMGDIVPNPPINSEQKKIGCSLNSYGDYLLNINKIKKKWETKLFQFIARKLAPVNDSLLNAMSVRNLKNRRKGDQGMVLFT